MRGNLIIITSPSGGGKGTLIREILATVPGIDYSVSFTTRPMRVGEENGKDYFFVTEEEFEQLRADGSLLESAVVHDKLYGTSRARVDELTSVGRDVILEIDVQGAKLVMDQMADAISIFIMPPSYEVLETRLRMRATENSDDLMLRLKNSFTEVREYSHFDYVVINRELFAAAAELKSIILSERLRTNRQAEAISVILDSFDISKHEEIGE